MALTAWILDLPEPVPVEHRWISVDGHRMHCLQAGSGPPLLLLHGLLGTAAAWEPLLPWLASSSTVYALDALGIGESERVPGVDVGIAAQADRVAAAMRRLGLRSADVLATSHGGAVAVMLAARHPRRVRSLLLHAPVNPYSNFADPIVRFYCSWIGRWFAHRVPCLPKPLQMLALHRMYGDAGQVREHSLEKYMSSLRVPGTVDYVLQVLRNWPADMRTLEGGLRRVRRFQALLVWGALDNTVSPASGEKLRSCFERCEMVVIPGAGHLPYEECPQPLGEAVNAFLRKRRSAPGQRPGTGLRLLRRLRLAGGWTSRAA